MRATRLAWVLAMAACNGAGSSPHAASPGEPTAATSAEGASSVDHPVGDPQPRLKLGKVVLTAPPRAPVELTVEVADSDESRRRGLMFRRSLPGDEGMFFVFPFARQQAFWMRNTLIPLDMFFIDSDFKVVGVVEHATPLTDDARQVEGVSQYVLEVNAGFAAEHGFGTGTEIRYTPPAEPSQEN